MDIFYPNPHLKVYLERVSSDATRRCGHRRHRHKPRVRVSLHPDSAHFQVWSSPDTMTTTAIVGPPVDLAATAFVASGDTGGDRRRRRRLKRALAAMIADLDVDAEKKDDILDRMIARIEVAIDAMGGLFEVGDERFDVRVTAKLLVATEGVEVQEEQGQEQEEEQDEGFDGMVPAAETAVEGLEAAAIDEAVETRCAICLEDFEGESRDEVELRRLGCLHTFHGDCLRAWLKRSHCCPLCRLQLPTQ